MSTASLVTTCPICGEELDISGTFELQGDTATFTSDDAGTKTAWDHQAKHDEEALNEPTT